MTTFDAQLRKQGLGYLLFSSIFRMWCIAATLGMLYGDSDGFNERLLFAEQLHRQGQYARAATILREALTEAEATDPGGLRVAVVLNNLGSIYHFMNKFGQAETCYRRAINIEAKAWGTVQDKPIRSTLNLAALYIDTGQYAKAEYLGLAALASRELEPPPPRENIARLFATLGAIDYGLNRRKSAVQYEEKALAIWEHLSPDGVEAMETLNNLGIMYAADGRNAEALAAFERALAMARKSLSPDDRLRAALLSNAGALHFMEHGAAAAEPFYQLSLSVAEAGLGREHPLVGQVLLSYAVVLQRTRQKTRAKEYKHRGEAILRQASGLDHRKYMVDIHDLLKE
jgi:tetratricopeptide (TPR) repeat protein